MCKMENSGNLPAKERLFLLEWVGEEDVFCKIKILKLTLLGHR